MTTRKDAQRAQFIAGLHALADILASNADIPLPTHRNLKWLIFGGGEDSYPKQKKAAAQILRAVGGTWHKQDGERLLWYSTRVGALELEVTVDRAAMCERVVKAVREVTRTVEVPVETRTETVTETVEDVEWVCRSLSSGDDAEVPA